jgi:DNA replication licensing factor MCM2
MLVDDIIPQETLKKYVLYAKRFVHPKLSDIDKDKITQFYAELRREAVAVGGMPVGVRHVESILRMAESNARMHLREYVRLDDVDVALKMMLDSFLMTQKYAVARDLTRKFARYLTHERDIVHLLLHVLDRLVREKWQYLQLVQTQASFSDVSISKAQLEAEAREFNIDAIDIFLRSPTFATKYTFLKNVIKPK